MIVAVQQKVWQSDRFAFIEVVEWSGIRHIVASFDECREDCGDNRGIAAERRKLAKCLHLTAAPTEVDRQMTYWR